MSYESPRTRSTNSLRSAMALLLILQMVMPTLAQAQAPSAQPQQGSPAMQTQTGQANEATSKVIADSPAAPMATVQATIAPNTSALTRDEQILQVLNRFTYGPRPGDLERVRAEGLSQWFTEQFNPQQIDDSALTKRLTDYPAMQLPINKLLAMYPNAQMIRMTMNGRNGVPGGQGEKQLYNTQIERYKDKKNGKDNAAAAAADSDPAPVPFTNQQILAMAPNDRFNALAKLTPIQINMVRRQLPDPDRDKLTEGMTPHQVEMLAAFNNPAGVIASELVQTKLLRDLYSERQLNEIMVDFWLNHFNVYMRKSQQAPYFITAYERDTIRPRALGHFENLLVATAISPAMLNYLDNASSVGPHSQSAEGYGLAGRGRFPQQQQQKSSGLNENYARELMELHTVGVNGGYTQKDVTEVAKVFTGWTLGVGPGGGQPIYPEFDRSKHEPGNKTVLGVKIKDDGEYEGMKVLHMLATSPQTASFISTKLAIRFVADEPPPALVASMADTFLKTDGDIRQVLLTMIKSPAFFSRDNYRAKVKTPQDYVISAVRASGADVASAGALAASIADLGQPLYGMQTPNGYSMRADPWNNTAALVSRLNFALALSSNRVAGIRTDWARALDLKPDASTSLQSMPPADKDRLLEDHLLHMNVSDRTRQAIMAQITAPPDQQQASLRQITAKPGRDPLATLKVSGPRNPPQITDTQTALAAGLIFGSPEFQRR